MVLLFKEYVDTEFVSQGKISIYRSDPPIISIPRIYDNGLYPDTLPHGKVSRIYFWSRLLTQIEMTDVTKSCTFEVNTTGNKI